MGSETRALIRTLQKSMNETLDALASLTDDDLAAACSHPCGHGPGDRASIWHLLANDIDHEKMHAGQVLSIRHDLRVMQTQTARMVGEWIERRAALVGTLVGLPDSALDARTKPEEWSIREVAEHTIFWAHDSLAAGLRDVAGGAAWQADRSLQYGGPVPRPKPVHLDG